jgi:hypothetical protein
MMGDQHDTSLESAYAATTARVRRSLIGQFDLRVADRSLPGYPPYPHRWREVWQLSVTVSLKDFSILIAIPKTFPDQLPIVYLQHDLKESGRTIPHLNREREFCTFDKSEVRLNADNPEGIVLSVIERAQKLLEEGVSGSNRGEYINEFEAYWSQITTAQSLSLVGPSDRGARKVFVLRLNPNWKNWSFLFAEEEASGKRWLTSVGYKNRPIVNQALYLPLKSLGLPPYPVTNGTLYQRLKEEDPDALRELLDFLFSANRPTAILFSVPAGRTERVMGAWWHPQSTARSDRIVRRNKASVKASDEFELGNHPVEEELSDKNRKGKLLCADVERVDQKRLSMRTTGARQEIFGRPVNIIGCGSIGSLAAARLAESGAVDKLRLIDYERLSPENVGRHYCGMSDVGEFKTVAIASKIQHHFPQIECETKQSEILDLLRVSPSLVAPASINLIAVGDLTTERRLNQVAMSATERISPHCYVWVEPHLYGGHALFIMKDNRGCFECAFDENFLFKRRIIKDTGQFSMREAGCRSTYMPYGGLYANEFVPAVVRFLLAAMGSSSENRVFSWTGDLDAARHEGIALAQEWVAAPSFSSFTRTLEVNPTCTVCTA